MFINNNTPKHNQRRMVLQNLKNKGETVDSNSFYAGPTTIHSSKILTNKRGEYITILKSIKPYRVMTFSYPTKLIEMFPTEKIQLLVHADHKNKTYPTAWEVKTNNKIHAKAAIGIEGIYLGSWNMSNNSTDHFHEIGIHEPKTETERYQNLHRTITEYFNELWEHSTKKEGETIDTGAITKQGF